jgi:major membrane immunogen (membrane-anchored lipoprotein)
MSKQDDIASQKREETDMSLSEARNGRSRILARQLARPLTAEEIDVVSGARRAAEGDVVAGAKFLAGGTCSAGTCCVPDCDD